MMPKKVYVVLTLILSLLLASCQLMPVEETLPEVPVIRDYEKKTYDQVKVMRGDLILSKDIRCSYEITRQEELSFSLGGVYIDQIYVSEGQPVKAGDLVASLDMEGIQQNLSSMEHALSRLYTQRTHLTETRDLELRKVDVVLEDIEAELKQLEEFLSAPAPEVTLPPVTEETLPDNTDETTPVTEETAAAAEETTQSGEETAETTDQTQATEETYEEPTVDTSWEEEHRAAQAKYDELHATKLQKQAERDKIVSSYKEQIRNIDDSIYIQKLRIEEKEVGADERRLYATIDGTVTHVRDVEEGQRSVKDQYLIVISDWQSAYILVKGDYSAYLPIDEVVTVKIGDGEQQAVVVDPAQIGIETTDDEKLSYLRLLQPDPTLNDGKSGTIHIVMDERRDVLYVDKDAVITSNGESFVYMLDENGLRVIQKIKTGFLCDDNIEVVEGLKEGDLVILD